MTRTILTASVVLTALLAPLATTSAVAQTGRQLTPSEAAAAFGSRERITAISLSPDGTRVALVSPGPEQSTVVQVIDTKNGTAAPVNYADGKPMTLSDCNWVSDVRLLCSLYGVSDENYGQFLAYQRLLALDADGKNVTSLSVRERRLKYAAQSDGYVLDWRDGKTDSVLVARTYVPGAASGLSGGTGMAEGLGVDLIDTRSGKVDHIESANPRARSYLSDGRGNVRIMSTDEAFRFGYQSRGITSFAYRPNGSTVWRPFSTYSSVTEQGLYPIGVDGAANSAYALKKVGGYDVLYRVSLDGSLKEELAYANPIVDVSGVVRVGRQGRIVGARYSTDRPQVRYFDEGYAALVTRLGKALPKLPLISIVDANADETAYLVHASSDVDPGRYFLYNAATKSLKPVGQDRPELAGVALGSVTSITYKAADGTDVPGYLTVPPGSAGKRIPAIVMPHGGPAARDEWGFDWLVQFFVNRGYAVLQPNYRGSTGYGEGWFNENGFRSWKIAIGDVNDAGRWLVKQGIADPARLAIVGWSYGGYAALQSNVLDADLFKAVVAIAPVTDLNMLRAEKRGFINSNLVRDYIGEGPQLVEGSPALHAGVFKAPVILFHGDKDINVGVAESRAMDKALKKAGKKSELIVYPKIDHQLRDSAVRTDMLTRADAFLTKALN